MSKTPAIVNAMNTHSYNDTDHTVRLRGIAAGNSRRSITVGQPARGERSEAVIDEQQRPDSPEETIEAVNGSKCRKAAIYRGQQSQTLLEVPLQETSSPMPVSVNANAKADAVAKAKIPNNKKVKDAAAGKTVEPGKPTPKSQTSPDTFASMMSEVKERQFYDKKGQPFPFIKAKTAKDKPSSSLHHHSEGPS